MVAGLQGTVAILDSLYGVPVFVGVVSQLAQSLEILATRYRVGRRLAGDGNVVNITRA